MSVFKKILNKLGLNKKEAKNEAPAAPAKTAKPAPKRVDVRKVTGKYSMKKPSAKAAPEAMSMVDVMSKLETMAKGTGLNWKQSIADLLAVLDIDNSYDNRKELAKELGCPEDLMGDSSKMNQWLHKTVLQKIAESGGNIPQDLLK